MNRAPRLVALLALATCVAGAGAQAGRRTPEIGYVYPAGGRRGTTVEVLVGGQALRNTIGVHVSGEGVRGEVVKFFRPLRGVQREQRQAMTQRLRELILRRWKEAVEAGEVRGRLPGALTPRGRRMQMEMTRSGTAMKKVDLPEHPLLRNLDRKDLRELLHVRAVFMNQRKYRQQTNQIAESVLLRLTIAPDAEPGDRELRLVTRTGLTNPLTFQVGVLPEVSELENNDPGAPAVLPEAPPLDVPVLINGQILPADVDRFRFRATRGQRLVIRAAARRLVPFLADAVPGWFQATLTLYDHKGRVVAAADDYRFDPDPVLLFEVPADGIYAIEIHDAIYRGREDFVYRLSISEQPFVTWTFPLGTRAGYGRYAEVGGWNVPIERMFLTSHRGWEGIREKVWGRGARITNPVTYAISRLPAATESEPNDRRAQAQEVEPPIVVDGRIEKPGDADVFAFDGRAGQEIVVEVLARRLQSPLDSVVWLTDAAGRVLACNDDYEHKDGHLFTDAGLLTHHADSYLRATLPADGRYCVRLADVQNQGGEACAYRLRISEPQPDFAVWITPSSVNVPVGRSAVLTVHVLRLDGFDGPITLRLKDAPRGFVLDGGRVPAGVERIRVTLTSTAPPRRGRRPVALKLEATAEVAGKRVRHAVGPADDEMQAFLYRHLVPAEELLVMTIGGRRLAEHVTLASDLPVRIEPGGTARVRVETGRRPLPEKLEIKLADPPRGVTLARMIRQENGLVLVLHADADARPGLADNLIAEVYGEITIRQRGRGAGKTPRNSAGKAAPQAGAKAAAKGQTDGQCKAAEKPRTRKQRIQMGTLPAIPIEIVSKSVARK